MKRYSLFALLIILFSVIFSCNSKKTADEPQPTGSPKAGPKKVVEDFTRAVEKKNYEKAWMQISDESQKSFDLGAKPEGEYISPYDNFKKIMEKRMENESNRLEIISTVVGEQVIEGDTATVELIYTKVPESTPSASSSKDISKTVRLPLIRQNDQWKINLISKSRKPVKKAESNTHIPPDEKEIPKKQEKTEGE